MDPDPGVRAEPVTAAWESPFSGRSFEELVAADEPDVVGPDDGEDPVVLVASRILQDVFAAARG
ncbi:hypothetical protein ACWEQL_06060 [Kitasatospora sp. NPDC004240]